MEAHRSHHSNHSHGVHGTHRVHGVHRVHRDAWGVPHLRADDALGLAYAQGHNAARDRAWQLEVERHRSQGTTAAFLGPEAVEWDRFARQARLDDTARRCLRGLEATDPETAEWVRAYVDGVNEALAGGAARAPEFAAVGLAPGRWEPWTPMGVWLSIHVLFTGFPAKLWREQVCRGLGADWTGLFAADGPGTAGSNGWLVPGDRTVTGAALLAGDPHRFIEAPGAYQQIRLACPEYDVVGFAVPGVPGIAHFGHTGEVAWAITNAMADYQDLYAERLRPCGPERSGPEGAGREGPALEALGPDGWRPVHRHTETIEVAGADPVDVPVVETERGPVVIEDWQPDPEQDAPAQRAPERPTPEQPTPEQDTPEPGVRHAVSLRYPARVRGDLGFSALPRLLRARTVTDVDHALDGWAEPVNVVQAADTTGGTLHRVAGAVPVRHPGNRMRVVPGWRAEHAWRSWHHPMPREDVTDIAVMANQRGQAAPLGVEFAPPYRADRIRQLLDRPDPWSAAEMSAIHRDTRLASAAPLLDLLARLGAGTLSPRAARLRERLLGWDRRMDADSAEAATYAELRARVVRRLAANPVLEPLAVPPPHPAVFRPWLALVPRVALGLPHLLTADRLPEADLTEAVRRATEDTAAEDATAEEPGTGDPAGDGPPPVRRWGDLHRLAPWQALPDGPGAATEGWPGLSGDHDCVLATSSVPGLTHHCARASAARFVWDLHRREDSRWVVPLGASGVPGDAHCRDQLEPWVRGELLPVITDWDLLTEESHDD